MLKGSGLGRKKVKKSLLQVVVGPWLTHVEVTASRLPCIGKEARDLEKRELEYVWVTNASCSLPIKLFSLWQVLMKGIIFHDPIKEYFPTSKCICHLCWLMPMPHASIMNSLKPYETMQLKKLERLPHRINATVLFCIIRSAQHSKLKGAVVFTPPELWTFMDTGELYYMVLKPTPAVCFWERL